MKTYEYLQERIEAESAVSVMDKIGSDGWKMVTISNPRPEQKDVEGNLISDRTDLFTFIRPRSGFRKI